MGAWERQQAEREAAMLFGSDTVVGALAVMKSVSRTTLPVVGDASGDFLGQVTERELVMLAQRLPLARLVEVVAARNEPKPAPRRFGLTDPNAQAVTAARTWRQ